MVTKILENELSRGNNVVVIADDVDTLLNRYSSAHMVGIDLSRDISLQDAIKIAIRMRPDKIIISATLEDIDTLDNISKEV